MRRPALLVTASVVAMALSPAAPRADPQPSLKDVLRLSGAWVQRFADDMVFVVADERYEQEHRVPEGDTVRVERRTLLSEIVFVRTPEEERSAGNPWVQFRDVVEVDGAPLADHRGRLERLFAEAGGSAYAQASAMIAESARYNIGPGVRTVNVPCFALFVLHPRNQPRFKFELAEGHVAGTEQILRFRERESPTLIRSPERRDLPASGVLWVEGNTGRVSKTRMEVQVNKRWTTTTEVVYGYDAGVDAWVPQTMSEHAGPPAGPAIATPSASQDATRAARQSLDCTATYTNFRRFRTDARIIR